MNLLDLFITFLFFHSQHCQATKRSNAEVFSSKQSIKRSNVSLVVHKGPLDSLKGLIFEKFPELILAQDESDFACACALGTFITQPMNDILVVGGNQINVDVAKLDTLLSDDLMKVPAHCPEPLASLRRKLGEFVTQELDIAKLHAEVASVPTFIGFSDLHKLIIKCAKTHLAVVSFDVAILRWVDLVSTDESIKSHIFKLEEPIVDELICQSMVSLMIYPDVHRYIKEELRRFMMALKELYFTQTDVYNSYAKSVARLMLPLPEGNYYRKKLTEIIANSSLQKFSQEHPLVRFSYLLIDRPPVTLEKLKEQSIKHEFKILIAASLGNANITFNCRYMQPSNQTCYKGYLSDNDQLAKSLQETDCNEKTVQIGYEVGQNGFDLFVAANVPLSKVILDLLWRYARGEAFNQEDMRDLLYMQASYGITMISAPKLVIVDLKRSIIRRL